MNEQDNVGTKIIGGLVAVVAIWGLWKVLQLADGPKKLDGITKSAAASQVLKLMDSEEDPSYSKSLNTVVKEHTKGMSRNKARQFKHKLENELNLYI